ncbi:MAG: Vitamin B12 import ATP-binding protein BtuD [Chroococcidiopsis cubana SAG 39.79]|nr:Vitamin B12 import ATP-binding protein BtuD [Chroococcidiopsis cubana SAG 39.79]
MKGLSTKNLALAYDGTPIIHDLNLAIPTGQITALVGANGCGKSTLLRGLARLLKPRGGAVYLNSTSILQLSTKEVAQQLGILPSSSSRTRRVNSTGFSSTRALSLSKLVATVVSTR